MPKVDRDHYPYTPKGIKDALEHSKRAGKPVEMTEGVEEYQYGGRVPMGGMRRPMGRPTPRPSGRGMGRPMGRRMGRGQGPSPLEILLSRAKGRM